MDILGLNVDILKRMWIYYVIKLSSRMWIYYRKDVDILSILETRPTGLTMRLRILEFQGVSKIVQGISEWFQGVSKGFQEISIEFQGVSKWFQGF